MNKNSNSKSIKFVEKIIFQARVDPSVYGSLLDEEFSDSLWSKISATKEQMINSLTMMSSFIPVALPSRSAHILQGIAASFLVIAIVGFLSGKDNIVNIESYRKQAYTGSVTYSSKSGDVEGSGKVLFTVSNGDAVMKGDTISTGEDKRASILFENGDVIRLDYNSSIKVKAANSGSIIIELDQGSLFAQAADDRSVLTIQTEFGEYASAKSTFLIHSSEREDGILVFKDKAFVNTVANEEIVERVNDGYSYFIMADKSSEYSVDLGLIDIDSLSGSQFVSWNISQSLMNPVFAENLGILSQIELPQLALNKTLLASTTDSKVTLEGITDPSMKVQVNGQSSQVTKDGIFQQEVKLEPGINEIEIVVLNDEGSSNYQKVEIVKNNPNLPKFLLRGEASDAGIKIGWNTDGNTQIKYDSIKVLYSTSPNPTYGHSSVKDVSILNNSYYFEIADGQLYYFKICAYSSNRDKCISYSNEVSVMSPQVRVVASPFKVVVNSSDHEVEWDYEGHSKEGFYVLWSDKEITKNMKHSDYRVKYINVISEGKTGLNAFKGDGTYNVRVCVKSGNECSVSSDTVHIELRK